MVRLVVVCTILFVVLALIVNVSSKETGKEWSKDKQRTLKKGAHYKKAQHEKLENTRHIFHFKSKHDAPKSHLKHLKVEKTSENAHHRRQLENARRHYPVTKERSRREDTFKPVHAFLRSLPSPLPVHKYPSSAKSAGHKQFQDKYRAMKSKRFEKRKKHLKSSKHFDW